MQPPIKRRPPGRPKKKRAREPNERRGHSKGLGIAKRCKSCGRMGHNKRSCKSEVGGNSSLPTAASGGLNNRISRQKQVQYLFQFFQFFALSFNFFNSLHLVSIF